MTSIAKRFSAGFAATAVVAVFLNILPYLRMRIRPIYDGYETLGFPFVFRSEGGFVWSYRFSSVALLADIVLALVVAFGVGYACTRVHRKDSA